jgi:hypothetical protein
MEGLNLQQLQGLGCDGAGEGRRRGGETVPCPGQALVIDHLYSTQHSTAQHSTAGNTSSASLPKQKTQQLDREGGVGVNRKQNTPPTQPNAHTHLVASDAEATHPSQGGSIRPQKDVHRGHGQTEVLGDAPATLAQHTKGQRLIHKDAELVPGERKRRIGSGGW